MSGERHRTFLMAERPPEEVLGWMRNTFMPEVFAAMNTPDVRRRIGLYGGDRIPENERNLTDARNRVSLIAEYEMARVATRILEGWDLPDLFFSYVVANRFPDLEVRDPKGRRGLRIEVKCLEAVAEEKSANFDTLKKDIHPRTDYIVIFLWEWRRDSTLVAWDRAPLFLKAFCFHAASLAHIRDWYWLNRPPSNLDGGLQGFDLRYAVNCSGGKYNQEEGNYGKLMRMWADDFPSPPMREYYLADTPAEYLAFRRSVIEVGFEEVCRALAQEVFGADCSAITGRGGRVVGWASNRVAFLLNELHDQRDIAETLRANGFREAYAFNGKYAWTSYALRSGRAVRSGDGNKPKLLKRRLLSMRQA